MSWFESCCIVCPLFKIELNSGPYINIEIQFCTVRIRG